MLKFKLWILLICAFISNYSLASPVWTFTPITATTVTVNLLNPNAIVGYIITNHSRRVHSLVLQPLPHQRQLHNLANDCQTVATLGYKESCILRILILGNLLSSNYNGGPIMCEFGSQGQCYRPEQKDIITVIVDIRIKSAINNLKFANNEVYKTLTLTNTSNNQTAHNIQAEITDMQAQKSISQDARDCKKVEPGQSCSIYFKRNNMQQFDVSKVKIKGENTESFEVSIKAE